MYASKMKGDILATIIRATSRMSTATAHTGLSMGTIGKSSSWITRATDSAQTGDMSGLFTKPSCLPGAAV